MHSFVFDRREYSVCVCVGGYKALKVLHLLEQAEKTPEEKENACHMAQGAEFESPAPMKSQVWWCEPAISALGRERLDDPGGSGTSQSGLPAGLQVQ